jgi:hypothetical protein
MNKYVVAITVMIFQERCLFLKVLSILTSICSKSFYEMEQHALKDVNSSWNAIVTVYIETTGGKSSNLHLNVFLFIYFLNTSVK